MAFSKALIRIALSMPFSLLTCSMTRLRSCCILGAPVMLVIRLFDQCKRNLPARAVLIDGDRSGQDFQESPEKRTPTVDHLASAHANRFADTTREVFRPLERT